MYVNESKTKALFLTTPEKNKVLELLTQSLAFILRRWQVQREYRRGKEVCCWAV